MSNGKTDLNSINTEIVSQFIQNQSKQIANSKQEIELNKKKEDNNYNYALKILEVQEKDRNEQRLFIKGIVNKGYYLIIILVFVLSLIITLSLYLDKYHLISPYLNDLFIALITAFGGYHYGLNKTKEK